MRMKELDVDEIRGDWVVGGKEIGGLVDEKDIEFERMECVKWKGYG